MIPAFDNVDFSQFSVEQRLALIGRIWDTFDDAPIHLTPAQKEELDRRVAEEAASGDRGISWAELKQRVQAAS